MGLFQSLRTGLSGLVASQNVMQTTGHNISNADSPGYTRQRAELSTRKPVDMERYQLGSGVDVTGIERMVDKQLETRIQNSESSLKSLVEQKDAMNKVEQIFNDLSENDLGSTLNQFFQSLNDLSQSPEDLSVRNQVISNGSQLAEQLKFTKDRLIKARRNINGQVEQTVEEINTKTAEIARLNEKIVSQENGGIQAGAANDLRDQRNRLVKDLSQRLDVRTRETDSGAMQIMAGGSFLVHGGHSETITTDKQVQHGVQVSIPRIKSTGRRVPLNGGSLEGLIKARDDQLLGVQKQLDEFTRTFTHEFNKLHSEGAGLNRLKSVTGTERLRPEVVSSSPASVDPGSPSDGPPLAADGEITDVPTDTSMKDTRFAGLPDDYFNGMNIYIKEGPMKGEIRTVRDFDGSTGTIYFNQGFSGELKKGTEFQVTGLNRPVQNGSFDVKVTNETTGNVEEFNIDVDLDGIGEDSDLQDIVDQVNSKVGSEFSSIQARVTPQNQFEMESTDDNVRFRFANDSSNFLASAGVNTFFSGSKTQNLSVRKQLRENPDQIAAALSNNKGDNTNVQRILGLREEKVFAGESATPEEFFERIGSEVGTDLQRLEENVENEEVLNEQLENQRERVSGVNLDEEAVNMIQSQRLFQSSARFVSVVNQMFSSLIQAT